MAPLILFAILFVCGLINTYFVSPKFLAWLRSLLPRVPFLKPKAMVSKKASKKDEGRVVDNKAELETVFATFDRDGDGFITVKELEESLRRLGLFSNSQEVIAIMEKADANGDGLIDLEEFRELYESLEGSGRGEGSDRTGDTDMEEDEEDLREAFDVFDENKDGLITVEELGLVLKSLGLKQGLKEEDCREMIKKVDLDGDGMVNFEEFKKMMAAKGGKLF